MKRLILSLFSFFALALACAQPPAVVTLTPTAPSPVSTVPSGGEYPLFTIALEYAIPGLASAYAPTGVTYAKPQPIFGMWGLIEPQPGKYNWGPLDNLVIEYQTAGFTGIQLLITAESPWASVNPPSLLNLGDSFPKDEYLDEYAAFVGRFVERYDGDGTDDAPGLLNPIHHYGIEREFTGFWPGSAEDYVRLLRTAYPVIHTVDPQAEVLIVAILMVDVFDGDPDTAELQRRLITPQTGIRKSVSEIQTILAACDAYDILDFHSLGDYTEIPPTAAWLRDQMETNDCGKKPLWIGDAFSMSALVGYNARPAWPATLETRDRVIDTLKLIADPSSTGHAEAKSWLYAQMASGLVKKVVVSAGEGLLGINIGNLEDWKTGLPAVDALGAPLAGTSMFMGMMDSKVTGQQVGDRLPGYRAPGQPRPAFFAVKLVNEKITGFTSVEKLDLGSGIWAYRFMMPSGPLWVLWYDDGKLYFPGEMSPTATIELAINAANVLITHTPTEVGKSEPETQVLGSSSGILPLLLESTPIFVQIAP